MRIERNKALMTILADCIIDGRFSKGYLEFRHPDYDRGNGVMSSVLTTLAQEAPLGPQRPAFHEPTLTKQEFHESRAYRTMMEQGLPTKYVKAALQPYSVDGLEESDDKPDGD